MNRIDCEFRPNEEGWRPGLPSVPTLCDVRPTADPTKCWGHLLVIGPVVNGTEGKYAVRVPSTSPLIARFTMIIELDPLKCEWRPIVVPDYPEEVHA